VPIAAPAGNLAPQQAQLPAYNTFGSNTDSARRDGRLRVRMRVRLARKPLAVAAEFAFFFAIPGRLWMAG